MWVIFFGSSMHNLDMSSYSRGEDSTRMLSHASNMHCQRVAFNTYMVFCFMTFMLSSGIVCTWLKNPSINLTVLYRLALSCNFLWHVGWDLVFPWGETWYGNTPIQLQLEAPCKCSYLYPLNCHQFSPKVAINWSWISPNARLMLTTGWISWRPNFHVLNDQWHRVMVKKIPWSAFGEDTNCFHVCHVGCQSRMPTSKP